MHVDVAGDASDAESTGQTEKKEDDPNWIVLSALFELRRRYFNPDSVFLMASKFGN